MKKVLILSLLIPILLLSDENYQKALDYLSGKIGAKSEVIKITDPKKCGRFFECIEELELEGKKEVTIKYKKIDYKSAVYYLKKSFDGGNIKAGKKLMTLFSLHPELKDDKELLKTFLYTKNKIENLKYIKEFQKAVSIKNDKLKSFVFYKRVLSTAPTSTIEYKIAKKRVQKIEEFYKQNFWQWLWFKIKSFFMSLFA